MAKLLLVDEHENVLNTLELKPEWFQRLPNNTLVNLEEIWFPTFEENCIVSNMVVDLFAGLYQISKWKGVQPPFEVLNGDQFGFQKFELVISLQD